MSFKILCSAQYFKMSGRVFDRITEEYNPPNYWFRLKIFGEKPHNRCIGHITDIWRKNGRSYKGFDPLTMFWISEPPISEQQKVSAIPQHYRVDIAPGHYEFVGLFHVRLPERPLREGEVFPEDNIPAHKLPEVRIDHSKNERENASRIMTLPYGTYYVRIAISDEIGNKADRIFKVWAYQNLQKCQIRPARFYEKFWIWVKSFFPSQ